MKKVGRPTVYTNREEYSERRKKQYRESKRRNRKKRKILENIELLTPKQFNKKYQTDLNRFINNYHFNYFFTGTVELSKTEKQNLWNDNHDIDLYNQIFETEIGYVKERKIGIHSLRRYTEKYIQLLYDRNYINKCFVVFELSKNNNYHVHIMFQSCVDRINFETTSENSWLLGNSITLPIGTESDKENITRYCIKEIKPSSPRKTDVNKVDNWMIMGDYSEKHTSDFRNPFINYHPLVGIQYNN